MHGRDLATIALQSMGAYGHMMGGTVYVTPACFIAAPDLNTQANIVASEIRDPGRALPNAIKACKHL